MAPAGGLGRFIVVSSLSVERAHSGRALAGSGRVLAGEALEMMQGRKVTGKVVVTMG